MVIEVRIGSTVEYYHVKATRAPRAYDYDAIEIGSSEDLRLVLIPDAGLQQQLDRYASGLYGAVDAGAELSLRRGEVEDMLWARLTARLTEARRS